MRAKEVVALIRVLPGFRDIYRYPAQIGHIKIRPAMITGNLAGVAVGWNWEANFEARWNFLRTRHRDKQGMKVSAVSPLDVTGINRVAPAPAGATFIILHILKYVLVQGVSLVEFC